MNYQAMKRQGGSLHTYYKVKEDSLKRLHTVWLCLCDIKEKAKPETGKISLIVQCCKGRRKEQAERRGIPGQ